MRKFLKNQIEIVLAQNSHFYMILINFSHIPQVVILLETSQHSIKIWKSKFLSRTI
jgi:hypothetical protein